jgi:hypothetical protein
VAFIYAANREIVTSAQGHENAANPLRLATLSPEQMILRAPLSVRQ